MFTQEIYVNSTKLKVKYIIFKIEDSYDINKTVDSLDLY